MTLEWVDNGSSQIIFKRRAINPSVSNCIPEVFLWIKMGSPDKKASLLNFQIYFIEYAAEIYEINTKRWLVVNYDCSNPV